MDNKVKKSFKLQVKRLTKVLEDLNALDVELRRNSEDGNGSFLNDVINDAFLKINIATDTLEYFSMPSNLLSRTQEISTLVQVVGEYKDKEKHLCWEVNRIIIGYPFYKKSDLRTGYEIETVKVLSKLISEVQKVFIREYNAGQCKALHVLEDFFIERVLVRKDKCAEIYIGLGSTL